MKTLTTTFCLFLCLGLSAQTSPLSITAEYGRVFSDPGSNASMGLRLNYALPIKDSLAFIISPGVERAVIETSLNSPCSESDASEDLCADLTAFIKSYEIRTTLSAGLRQQLGKFAVGASLRVAYRLNKKIDLTRYSDVFFATSGPTVTHRTAFGERFDPQPGAVDDPDFRAEGDRLRLQVELEGAYAINQALSVSLIYRHDALRRNRQRILSIGGLGSSDEPSTLFEGISRGHYVQLGLRVGL